MSLNPLNELKRRLEDDKIPLPKRYCLAKNVVHSHHFPTAPKERIVAEWLGLVVQRNKLNGKDLRDVLGWLSTVDDLTGEFKTKLVQIVADYLQKNPMNYDDIQHILVFIEHPNISTHLQSHIDDYIFTVVTILQHLHNDGALINVSLSQRLLNNLIKYYKESKKKLEFIIKLLDGNNLETIFSYLNTECRNTAINVCRNILFPVSKKSFFISFLQTLIRKDNIDELLAEKGDNIQSVLKIMSTFFTFPKGRTAKDQKFLYNFIDVFVSCFSSESQMIFAFYIMVSNSLNMHQNYLQPVMAMPPIIFEESDEKIKRNLFLNMLEILLQNEVNISVKLTDTFGEKISKVEIKKSFMSFLQAVMMGQLKLEGKLDKTTLNIIKLALKLDPVLIEQKMDVILPTIMTAKKSNSNVLETYIEMLNCLLEILFKLSRGTLFVNQILPHLKLSLEAVNTEQFELKQKVKECTDNGIDCDKINNKIITGNDVFPQECILVYGKLTSELMFRQSSELLTSLQKDFEEHCLMMLEEDFVSPSIITLAEVLSAILSSFVQHSKMADHTVPQHIAESFWTVYEKFEVDCMKKFGECVLKLSYNPILLLSFFKLCQSFSQLKLLNMKYGNTKVNQMIVNDTCQVFDLSIILPCLNNEQWTTISSMVQENEANLILNNLLLLKMIALEILSERNWEDTENEAVTWTKSHIIKQLTQNTTIFGNNNNYFSKVLFANLDRNQCKQLTKYLVQSCLNNSKTEILKCDAITNSKLLLDSLVTETAKSITQCLDNVNSLNKAVTKTNFDLPLFLKDVNIREYFNKIAVKTEYQVNDTLTVCVDILKQLQIYYLEEKIQLTVIFVLLLLKKCCPSKKLRRNIDHLLQSIFELSSKCPDLYKIFPVELIFSFEDKLLIDLLTLKIKTSNQMLIIKLVLELGVKKVKTDNDIVKNIVELLLNKQNNKEDSSIEDFSNPAFQISCIILPIIAKEKKAITTSAYRSVLANLQEKLHQKMLEAFKNIDIDQNSSVTTVIGDNPDDSMVVSESTVATLNAIEAYSLTLLKYCETNDTEEIKNLDYLWSSLEFFVRNSIITIQCKDAKNQHVESSIHLLNVTLRHIKKLESHEIFQNKDKLFTQMWRSVVTRLKCLFDGRNVKRISDSCLDDIAVTLKFICELVSVECFVNDFVKDLSDLTVMKDPSSQDEDSIHTEITSHKVSKYLWTQCLKANIVVPKCVAMSKLMFKNCKDIRLWIQLHYDRQGGGQFKMADDDLLNEDVKVIEMGDSVCELLKIDLDTLSQVILSAKRISLDYKFLDAIFILQHLIHVKLGHNTKGVKCNVSWQSFLILFEGSLAILNSLLMSREEILEDRWPNYMQCYRALVYCLCERSSSEMQLERHIEDKLVEIAHSVEKLTQSICKRKTHISRLAAYTVADMCSYLERTSPSRSVRQHLENSIALLIQASDSSYAVAFLRRALAGTPGHMTMTNMYSMYKRYHKYVGNA